MRYGIKCIAATAIDLGLEGTITNRGVEAWINIYNGLDFNSPPLTFNNLNEAFYWKMSNKYDHPPRWHWIVEECIL